mmetsp:Transcript_4705/g.11333  ORF Transcript_4705/g.11333 Transcript_4705/m.11333 type:complete len:228 (+) Transcript_4705:144-827(+)
MMRPCMASAPPNAVAYESKSPRETLAEMRLGNSRFWTGKSERPNMSMVERRELISGQRPRVMVIGCADSRVPIEIVFDLGIGDVFVCRNAGNLTNDSVAGSIDFAVHVLGIKLVVVMGHQGCFSVKAAMAKPFVAPKPPMLAKMLVDIRESLDYCVDVLDGIEDKTAHDREAVIANAQVQVRKIVDEPGIKLKIARKELLVIASFYDMSSGIVDFVEPREPSLRKEY